MKTLLALSVLSSPIMALFRSTSYSYSYGSPYYSSSSYYYSDSYYSTPYRSTSRYSSDDYKSYIYMDGSSHATVTKEAIMRGVQSKADSARVIPSSSSFTVGKLQYYFGSQYMPSQRCDSNNDSNERRNKREIANGTWTTSMGERVEMSGVSLPSTVTSEPSFDSSSSFVDPVTGSEKGSISTIATSFDQLFSASTNPFNIATDSLMSSTTQPPIRSTSQFDFSNPSIGMGSNSWTTPQQYIKTDMSIIPTQTTVTSFPGSTNEFMNPGTGKGSIISTTSWSSIQSGSSPSNPPINSNPPLPSTLSSIRSASPSDKNPHESATSRSPIPDSAYPHFTDYKELLAYLNMFYVNFTDPAESLNYVETYLPDNFTSTHYPNASAMMAAAVASLPYNISTHHNDIASTMMNSNGDISESVNDWYDDMKDEQTYNDMISSTNGSGPVQTKVGCSSNAAVSVCTRAISDLDSSIHSYIFNPAYPSEIAWQCPDPSYYCCEWECCKEKKWNTAGIIGTVIFFLLALSCCCCMCCLCIKGKEKEKETLVVAMYPKPQPQAYFISVPPRVYY